MNGADKAEVESRITAEKAAGGVGSSDAGASGGGIDTGSAMMAVQMASGMSKSLVGGSGSGSGSGSANSAGSSSGSLAPAALPAVVGGQSTDTSAGGTTNAPVEVCTTAATGLGTAECQALLAKKNPGLIQVANSSGQQAIARGRLDTSALGTNSEAFESSSAASASGVTNGRGIAEQSIVAKAFSASLLRSNSVTLSKMCKSNELIGCRSL